MASTGLNDHLCTAKFSSIKEGDFKLDLIFHLLIVLCLLKQELKLESFQDCEGSPEKQNQQEMCICVEKQTERAGKERGEAERKREI